MCEEFSFISSNGHDKVYAWKFLPKKEQIGVIHLIHGFGEHTQRFSCIINYFNDSGFIVVADDHIGHGVTGICNKNLGVAFPVSYLLYLDDEKKIYDIIQNNYSTLPFFMYGHSWGALLILMLLLKYQIKPNGIVLSGLLTQFHGCDEALRSYDFMNECEQYPKHYAAAWIKKFFAYLNERVLDSNNPIAWNAVDKKFILKCCSDSLSPMIVNLGELFSVIQSYQYINSYTWLNSFPGTIPILIQAGSNDPCCNYGKGIKQFISNVKTINSNIRYHIYNGYRHSLYGESPIQSQIAREIISFYNDFL